MRILVATDAWHPQVNGVVRTLERVASELPALGARCDFVTPALFRSMPLPGYPEIPLSFATSRMIAREIERLGPDHIHIATEGPIGMATRRACLRAGRVFTTSYHTRFPEYLRARVPVPTALSYAWLRRFHGAAAATLVATQSLARELEARGFPNIRPWSRGVDAELYHPRAESVLDLPRPIFLYVGRVAVEKNLPAFLSLDLPGSKVVVGDGPDLASLKARFPDAHFLGAHVGERLAELYASADVFVFPSLTDTFGIVILEALASGLPVAAFPVTGPLDVLSGTNAGALDRDLKVAAMAALALRREDARALALTHSWRRCAEIFLETMQSVYRPAATSSGEKDDLLLEAQGVEFGGRH